MTWDEIWRAIKGGDTGVIIATLIEVAIMASLVAIFAIAWLYRS